MILGLTSKEAHIYVFFAKNKSDKRKEVMSELDIRDQELTDSLQRLTKKGFMEIKLDDNNIFSIVPLKMVMERLIEEKLREVQEIQDKIKDYKLP